MAGGVNGVARQGAHVVARGKLEGEEPVAGDGDRRFMRRLLDQSEEVYLVAMGLDAPGEMDAAQVNKERERRSQAGPGKRKETGLLAQREENNMIFFGDFREFKFEFKTDFEFIKRGLIPNQ